ncbi:anti-sigma factor antagonist [Kibdelosporangium aridum]|uniref:Anti-sigma factor antagonist n=1 Tax=Kibdelosporangium aridum TaxID=2030 RepID=A0A428ZIY2_KIBAR|nr:STAS domain-containing protein [Kibdelosporangium aridum]RSM87918.1 anti-sigma factor antagonist [Kibdelosporangium aridum]
MSTDACNQIIAVTTSRIGEVAVVHVAGEVDMSSVAPFATAVRRELDTRPTGLVMDLLDVDFCGSAGLNVLVQARNHADSTHTGVHLVATRPAVLRPLEIMGLTQLFAVHLSVSAAVSACISTKTRP